MNATPKENNPAPRDEIDLLELFGLIFRKISQFFKSLFNFILHSIIFLIKKSPYLIVFTMIGMVIGFIIFKNTKRYYSSELVAQPNGISNGDMIGYINDLHQLCKESNYPSLAEALGLSDSTANKIKDIQAFWIVDVNKDGIGDYVDYNSDFNLKDTTQQLITESVSS